jgi:hypothetical protein
LKTCSTLFNISVQFYTQWKQYEDGNYDFYCLGRNEIGVF